MSTNEKHIPVVGEKLYLYTPCNNYWVSMVRNPFTVENINKNKTPADYVMLTPKEKRRMSYYSLDMLDDIKRDKFNRDEEARDRAARLFILDQFCYDPMNVSWDEVDGDLQELLDSAEWYITVQA